MSEYDIKEYDDRGNCIHYKSSDNGYESWGEHDENNRLIYWKNNKGYEEWYKYNRNNKQIDITEKEYKEIEFRAKEKEYNSRTKCSRFELIDI